jgi:putrescine:ornithine antiporter
MMQAQKKMTLIQLTFLVAVNMMGSGIIMLPTNMARVGAISLLSWIVTALGSMAIAYGFAQAGLLNQRSGGMAAYSEDAYGKPGYFQVFFLYFVSLAIANVAVAISAVGYLASFFPWLSSTPVATCTGVIALLWLTTVANFGGPSVTGRIGSITVWGVILPVGLISILGWFWFSADTFAAAWNPQGLSIGQGMGSSIALTLWAFLGLESAAQNSDAVENPKRDVPLACMLGTVGAAVIYILSTMVIQGIVPNADLANSTGPFGLAYARMFNPAIGSIVMALAVMACLGSLLGWQFTLAQTAKSGADEHMFPGIFSKVTKQQAPIAGMLILGVVQTLMALMTISPTLSDQFSALVNLAVVTNVVPYLVALSALPWMMQKAGVGDQAYRRTLIVAVVAMAYSTYAIYASGKDAVFGGMLVMAIGFVIWGFIASRFAPAAAAGPVAPADRRARGVAVAVPVILLLLTPVALFAQGTAAPAGTLDQIRAEGRIRLGYRVDAPPFAFKDETGQPAGYSTALCRLIADAASAHLGLSGTNVEWVPVSLNDRFTALQQGRIHLLCGAETVTLSRRTDASFSIPIFPGGIGALVRADAPARLRDILAGRGQTFQPTWRASATQVLRARAFSAIQSTTADAWLSARVRDLNVIADVTRVPGYDAGIQGVLDRRSDVFFGERAVLLDATRRNAAARDLVVIDRLFTYEPLALALRRGDEDFRLLVDRTLSRLYFSGEIAPLYTTWFGEPDDNTLTFFRWNRLPE